MYKSQDFCVTPYSCNITLNAYSEQLTQYNPDVFLKDFQNTIPPWLGNILKDLFFETYRNNLTTFLFSRAKTNGPAMLQISENNKMHTH